MTEDAPLPTPQNPSIDNENHSFGVDILGAQQGVNEAIEAAAVRPEAQRDALLHEEAAARLGEGSTADWHRTYAESLHSSTRGAESPLDSEHHDDMAEFAEEEAGKKYDLEKEAQGALEELDRIMDENRNNPNRLVMKSLDQARRYLESLSDLGA